MPLFGLYSYGRRRIKKDGFLRRMLRVDSTVVWQRIEKLAIYIIYTYILKYTYEDQIYLPFVCIMSTFIVLFKSFSYVGLGFTQQVQVLRIGFIYI